MTAPLAPRWLTDRHRILVGRTMTVTAIVIAAGSVIPYLRFDPAGLYQDWIIHNSGGAVLLALIGLLLVKARPRNRAAWLFPWMALFQALNAFGNGLMVWLGVPSGEGAVIVYAELGILGWIGYLLAVAAWIPGIAPMVTLALLWFPDGRLPSNRWRPVEWLAVASIAAATTAVAWSVRPVGGVVTDTVGSDLFTVSLIGLLASVVLSLSGLIVRYRRSRGVERRRFRWIAWSTGLTAVSFVVGNLIDALVLGDPEGPVFKAMALPSLVVFIGGYAMAIWRHQLFDIDLVISRTLIWGSLAAFIGAVYVGFVLGVGSLIGQSSGEDATLSLAATAVVAFLFQPVRRRVEHAANRLVFGRRATPYEVLADLSHRLARTEATDGLLQRMVTLLADGVGAESAVVWQRGDDRAAGNGDDAVDLYHPLAVFPPELDVAARSGSGSDPLDRSVSTPIGPDEQWISIERSGERLGALTVTKRKGEELTPIERRLVEDLAGSAGLVLDRARLDADLAAKASALVRSRSRLVEAQTEERQRMQERLQSDTHQHLTALADGLDRAAGVAAADGVEAIEGQLEMLAAEIRLALNEIDGLARGMYPPVLESQGLVAAVEALAGGLPLPVEVRSTVSTRLNLDIEQAVYFTVGEALTNVVKHAEATEVCVDLDLDEGAERLTFQVADNGKGFGERLDLGAGTGLAGLRDRIDTVGGSLTVDSATNGGAVVSGSVPLAGVDGTHGHLTGAVATLDHRA